MTSMESEILQPVGGTKQIEVYPYIRAIDMMSSNSYIISSESQLALIDPGGLDDQTDRLLEVLFSLHERRPRPLLVYLTHIHADHSFQLNRRDLFESFDQAALAVQERGALALERGATDMTLSRLLGKKIDPISPEIRLLSSEDLRDRVQRSLTLDNGMRFEYATESIKIGDGLILSSQRVDMGAKDQIEIFHLPGHSPDSVAIRVGNMLIIGDLLFASNPGVAGIPGWSRNDQMGSIRRALWILEERDIRICCPGHGGPMDVETVKRTLARLHGYTDSLADIAVIDHEWARSAADYSHQALREMERLFTIMTGRLVLVSSLLEDLEEEDAARDTEALVDAAVVDRLFSRMDDHLSSHRADEILDMELVLKAGQMVGKLERIFERKRFEGFFEDHLLRRAERLLNDYMVTYRGFQPYQNLSPADLNSVVAASLEGFSRKPYDENAILEAETDEEYLLALKARISHVNLSERADLVFEGADDLPEVLIDVERFSDLVIDVLERFVAARAERIVVRTFKSGDSVSASISGTGPKLVNPFREDERKFLQRSVSLCGGMLVEGRKEKGAPPISVRFFSEGKAP
jgi:glyoxylase-like metal-dependent hydrolase (beta-lactamase superfamily II)